MLPLQPIQRSAIPPVSPVRPLAPRQLQQFQQLPADIRRIYLPPFLSGETLIRLCQTSQQYRQLCQNPELWLQILQREYNWTLSPEFLALFKTPLSPNISRALYQILKKFDTTPFEIQNLIQSIVRSNRGQPISFSRLYSALGALNIEPHLIRTANQRAINAILITTRTPNIPAILGPEADKIVTQINEDNIKYTIQIHNVALSIYFHANGFNEISIIPINRSGPRFWHLALSGFRLNDDQLSFLLHALINRINNLGVQPADYDYFLNLVPTFLANVPLEAFRTNVWSNSTRTTLLKLESFWQSS